MKIALIQFNSLIGDVEGNAREMRKWIAKGQKAGADIICFHEMALLGYPPRDLLELPSVIKRCEEEAAQLAGLSGPDTVLVFGGVARSQAKTGKTLFNVAYWCRDGLVEHQVSKRLLPTYDVFDESRYFEPGTHSRVIEFKGCRLGLTVCEDIWNDPSLFPRPLYAASPVEDLARQGCEFILNISASPFSQGKAAFRLKILQALAAQYGVSSVYVNQVGGNDELIFDGGSMAVGSDGQLAALGPFFKEGMVLFDRDSPAPAPKLSLPDEMALLHDALVLGLRDYVRKCGFQRVALGLSGGIDSALTAYLAAKALGPENVLGLLMPSRFSSSGSLKDSRKLARNLKIKTREVSIEPMHRAYLKTFQEMFGRKKPDTTEENIQARIRGDLLMAVSNKLGHLVLSTGNKSELAVGYCTLYGDMAGGLAVISDLPKTSVYALSRYINRKNKIIPQAILEKAPSAELKPNQTDQDSLPPYEILDGIMKAYVEEMKTEEEIISSGFEPQVVRRILRLINQNEYKRRQAAPGLKVTSKAFGVGRRFPIACKF